MKKLSIVIAILMAAVVSLNAQSIDTGFKIKASGAISSGNCQGVGDNNGNVELGFGYQFCPYVYVGLQVGVLGPVQSDFKNALWALPVLGNVEVTIPTQGIATPLVDFSYGASVATFGKKDGCDTKYSVLEALPGCAFKITDLFSIQANVGYAMIKGTSRTENCVMAKVGLVFTL